MEIVRVTHQVQYCPRCDRKNVSYNWERHSTHRRMECIACGNHWVILSEDTVEKRAATGLQVENQIQIANIAWQDKIDDAHIIPPPSKSAINAGFFAGTGGEASSLETTKPVRNKSQAPYIGSLSALLIALMIVPQLSIGQLAGFEDQGRGLDHIVTSSIEKVNKPLPKMQFSDVKFYKIVRGNRTFVNVRGVARNLSAETFTNPDIRIFVKNSTGQTVHNWTYKVKNKKVSPGDSFSFQSESITQTGSANSILVMLKK